MPTLTPPKSAVTPLRGTRSDAGDSERTARPAGVDELSKLFEDARHELREGHLAVRDSTHGGLPERGHVRPGRDLGKDPDEGAA